MSELTEFGIENPVKKKDYKTLDSGKRQEYASGMKRDLQDGKPCFELCTPLNCSKEDSLLYQWAMLMERGKSKYGLRNWEKANSQEELERFKASAARHFQQWLNDWDSEECHAAAICFNVQAYMWLKSKLNK